MKSPPRISLLFVTLFLAVSVAHQAFSAQPAKITALGSESYLKYLLIHPLHHVEAISKEIQCTIDYDDATHTVLQTSFSADVSSFDSGNSNRDSHAMEVLDALTYPTVSFESTKIEPSGIALNVQGNLTFHGRTRPISFVASSNIDGNKLTVIGQTAVSLTAFDIERPSLLLMPVEDSLKISFDVVFPLGNK
jgi:polyisoprenoid-binding protein YceI